MEAWRKGSEFLRWLECKQQILRSDIAKTEKRLAQIEQQLAQYRQEIADINQQIKMLTPTGIICQADIYKGIRQQGALLTHQLLVFHKISQLESDQQKLEYTLTQMHSSLNSLEKKHYKITHYLQPLRRDYIRRSDNVAENDLQEIAIYGKNT